MSLSRNVLKGIYVDDHDVIAVQPDFVFLHPSQDSLVQSQNAVADIGPGSEQSELEGFEAVGDSESECERLQRETEETHERAKADGYAEGFAVGSSEARQQAEDVYRSLIEGGERIVYTANQERQRLLSSASSILTEIAMESVRVLLRRELESQPFDIQQSISELLQYAIHATGIEIRVCPSDYEIVVAAKPIWQDQKLGEWDVVVIADPTLEAGGCKIRSTSGYIDASMEAKTGLLREKIQNYIGRFIDESE